MSSFCEACERIQTYGNFCNEKVFKAKVSDFAMIKFLGKTAKEVRYLLSWFSESAKT